MYGYMGNTILFVFSLLCFCLVKNGYSLDTDNRQELDKHTQIIELSSLLPSTVCNTSTTQSQGKGRVSLNIVHRYGPCFQQEGGDKQKIPSPREILEQDQARVKWLHSRISKYTGRSDKKNTNEVVIPATLNDSLGTFNYIVRVGFGTPPQFVPLVFDTGSDITWLQCDPFCRNGNCHPQKDPIFNAEASYTYVSMSCSTTVCSSFTPSIDPSTCEPSTCTYEVSYGDGSTSSGFLAQDRLSYTTSEVFHQFYFGCAKNTSGSHGFEAGMLGLDRSPLSFPSQTAYRYNKFFSYCLPSSPNHVGHLSLGRLEGYLRSVKYTPIPPAYKNSPFYGIEITGISFNGRNLTIPPSVFSNAGAIIDSGTVVSRLPPDAYPAFRHAFRESMSGYRWIPDGFGILDSCYDIGNQKNFPVPAVSFFLGGDVEVKLHPSGVIYAPDESTVCLAFAENHNQFEEAIFGNIQQKQLEVVYDGLDQRVGFVPWGCN